MIGRRRFHYKLQKTPLELLLVVLLFACSMLGQQSPGVLEKAHSRIAGHVLSAADGHKISGATVSISNVQGGALVASVLSGDDGAFVFQDLSPGKYSLSGQRRGFIGASYEEHDQFSSAIVTGSGLDTTKLVLQLEPEATILGRVLDEDGELVRGAQVTLYREGYATGKKQVKAYTVTQTDSFGEFALSQLRSGRYFVAVRATPWYAVAAAPIDPQSPILTGVDPALDVAYPLTFNGDVTQSDDAVAIVLKAGNQIRTDVHLSPVPALKISFRSSPDGPGGRLVSLQTPVFGGFEQLPAQLQSSPDGASQIVGLGPATYRFETFDPSVGNKSQMGELDLAGGSVEIGPLGSVAEGSMQITVVVDSGEKPPAQTIVALLGTHPGPDQRQMLDVNGAVTFRGVPPDDYHFLIFGGGHTWQTVQVAEGDKPLNQDHRQLAAGESASLKLVIASTAKAVEGLAVRDGKPFSGAMIVLVPVDAMANTDLFRRDQSDQDGTFSLPDVAAGRYILIAVENGWKLEWGRPEVLSPFLAQGLAVQVLPTERKTLHLASPVAVQAHP